MTSAAAGALGLPALPRKKRYNQPRLTQGYTQGRAECEP